MYSNVIDFHSHIIPGADHGCYNSEVFRRQWEIINNAGICGVVATPHFYPHGDSVASFLARRERGLEKMKPHLSEGAPKIYVGAEVLVCPNLQNIPDFEKLCIEGTNCILLEMPFSAWSAAELATVRAIAERGFVPLMAHIDRYALSDVLKLASLGVPMQVNASSVCKLFHTKNPFSFLKQGCVYAIGSDLHGTDGGYKKFLKASKVPAVQMAGIPSKSQKLLKGAIPL